MNAFLPKGYKVPESEGNYYKFGQGDNRFRILSSAITGWECWTKDSKPVRQKEAWESRPEGIKMNDSGQFQKHFWAFIVYNYDANKAQIMELTQKSIMGAIQAYNENPKWGDPTKYDLVVDRKGEGLETEYTTIAEPHSPAPVVDISKINLNALYEGADPWISEGNYEQIKYPEAPEEVTPF